MAAETRPHTGRQRNEAARHAILDAARRLFTQAGGDAVTVAAIATEAGVGKQTIYRWWTSKYAILLEALTDYGRAVVPEPDTGALDTDLTTFLVSTFAGSTDAAPVLRVLMAEAQRDESILRTLRDFTDARRASLRRILDRGRERGELDADADLELLADQAYGVLWYRLLLGREPLDASAAERLALALIRQSKHD